MAPKQTQHPKYIGESSEVKGAQLCPTLCDPGQNTGVGRLSLLQGIFLTRELNLGLLHCRWILYQLNYQGSLEAKAALFLLSVNTQYRKPFRWRVVSERALVESSGLTVGP